MYKKLPPIPEPPVGRVIKEGFGYFCKKCGKQIAFDEKHTCKKESDEYVEYEEDRHIFDIDEEV